MLNVDGLITILQWLEGLDIHICCLYLEGGYYNAITGRISDLYSICGI